VCRRKRTFFFVLRSLKGKFFNVCNFENTKTIFNTFEYVCACINSFCSGENFSFQNNKKLRWATKFQRRIFEGETTSTTFVCAARKEKNLQMMRVCVCSLVRLMRVKLCEMNYLVIRNKLISKLWCFWHNFCYWINFL
jgi:hypothetical protein